MHGFSQQHKTISWSQETETRWVAEATPQLDYWITAGATPEIYLPVGTSWTDAWTSQTLEGGQRLLADAPLEHIPLYVRGQINLPLQLHQ